MLSFLDPRVEQALLLTGLGAAGTGLGGLMVVVQPKLDSKKLGLMQGLAAGLMLSISFFDLMPESVEAIGNTTATVCFFLGVAFFALIVAVLPEPDASKLILEESMEEREGPGPHEGSSAVSEHQQQHQQPPKGANGATPRRSTRGKAAAAEAPTTEAAAPPAPEKRLQTSKTQQERLQALADKRRVLLSGLITALGIALHNFPEGVAVFLASVKSSTIGLSLAIAIALHNIPEGVAVALPVYFATGSRWRGFQLAFLSGLAEPAAVILLGVMLRAFWLDPYVIDCLLAAVGGIMAWLALFELMPLAIEHIGRAAVVWVFVGMAIMSTNLLILEQWMHMH